MHSSGSRIDRFIIESELGKGGMATVYKVRHAILETSHALKVLAPELAIVSPVRERFFSEGRIQARLDHPNIVRVTDTVETRDVAGLVMDFVPGFSLKRLLRERAQPLDTELVRQIFLQVLEGVGFAHRADVIHRDLKPENVMLVEVAPGQYHAKVLDFGIAKVLDDSERDLSLTKTGMLLGSPHYMSPEQILRARNVTVRSDIFSLGAMLYVMTTLRFPFSGSNHFEVLKGIDQGRVIRPEQLNPDIDRTIARAVMRALARDPALRFGSCGEFADAIRGAKRAARKDEESEACWSEQTVPSFIAPSFPDEDDPRRMTRRAVSQGHAQRGPVAEEVFRAPLREVETTTRQDGPADVTARSPATKGPKLEIEVEELVQVREEYFEEVVRRAAGLFRPAETERVKKTRVVSRPRRVRRRQAVPFVDIEPGQFTMGSPEEESGRGEDEPLHEVIITRAFQLQTTLVTQAQWTALMKLNPSSFQGLERPVERVTWFDAVAYCNAFSEAFGLEPAYVLTAVEGRPGEEGLFAKVMWKGLDCPGYRLPTEAEWEYACRAGTSGPRYGELDAIAWWGGNSGNETHPVAQKQANPWGLYDMLGNLWEWCWDWYGPVSTDAGLVGDPTGPATGRERLWRGGSWGNDPEQVRAATRTSKLPNHRPFSVGFRLARTIE
ncbi:MAG: bifunctional serine/threonine-protein kinase/formylglycine-generating enzyme family protein [Myxococcales bacterium]|jgi:serine/threonine protein kinase